MSRKVPDRIREYLESAWPYQFLAAGNGKGTATPDDLMYFAAQLWKILDTGVEIEQVKAALVAYRNQPGGVKRDRGEIVRRLWELVPKKADAKPELTTVSAQPIFERSESPWRMYARDRDAALRAFPWLHSPTRMNGREYARAVDTPFFQAMLGNQRLNLLENA